MLSSSYDALLRYPGPFNETPAEYSPAEAHTSLASARVLVIGAGGLGCEMIKNLALSGFRDIDIIDMDTIAVLNLNRQFLYQAEDVGRPKAEVAASLVRERIADPGLTITPHFCSIQSKNADFYAQFTIIVCGLDNVEARRWINALLVGMVDSELNNLVPLIDGGTEGFRGQARVIIPTITLCFECSLDMLSPKVTYPVCTITNTPRLPEHCIEWASQFEWSRRYSYKFDPDDPAHVDAMHALATERAAAFAITGVTRSLTLGVVKNIIPAIGATNAVIAAACCNEAFKLVTSCRPVLNNYMMYSGDDSIFTYTYAHSKKASCPVCGTETKHVVAKKWWKLHHFLKELTAGEFLLRNPSVSTAARSLYLSHPELLRQQTAANLDIPLRDLVKLGEEMVVTDNSLPILMRVIIDAFDGPDAEPVDISSILRS